MFSKQKLSDYPSPENLGSSSHLSSAELIHNPIRNKMKAKLEQLPQYVTSGPLTQNLQAVLDSQEDRNLQYSGVNGGGQRDRISSSDERPPLLGKGGDSSYKKNKKG